MNEDKIVQEIITLKEDVRIIKETMVTKDDLHKNTDLLETIVTIVKKTQDDHVFSVEWLKRVQNQVDEQKEEIRAIKM